MPCAASFPGYEIDYFLENFFDFFEVRRLGYLKPAHSKAFKSEQFLNHFPSTGMETLPLDQYCSTFVSKPLPLNGDGNVKYLGSNP